MKLPWDKNYLKIAFHVIFTLFVIYVLVLIVSNIIIIFNVFIAVINKLLSLLSPLIIGLVIAYLIDPLAEFFQHKYDLLVKLHFCSGYSSREYSDKRMAGTIVSYLIVLGGVSLLVFVVFKSINGKFSDIEQLTQMFTMSISGFNDLLISMEDKLAEIGILENMDDYINRAIGQVTSFIQNLGVIAVDSITQAGSKVANFFIGIVIAFYFLSEKKLILNKCNDVMRIFLPTKLNVKVKSILGDVNAIFSGYIRGQLVDAAIMAILISITLSLIGIKFPVIIGIITGIANLIPYFGAIIGFLLAVTVALLSGDYSGALYSGIALFILQQIDGIFIVPKVVGEKVEMHPVAVLLALSVAGGLFGIMGMILAIPVVATLKLFLIRYYKEQY